MPKRPKTAAMWRASRVTWMASTPAFRVHRADTGELRHGCHQLVEAVAKLGDAVFAANQRIGSLLLHSSVALSRLAQCGRGPQPNRASPRITTGLNLRGQYLQPHAGGRPPHGNGSDIGIFLEKRQESILSVAEGFDWIIVKDYPTSMFPDGAFACYSCKQGGSAKLPGRSSRGKPKP